MRKRLIASFDEQHGSVLVETTIMLTLMLVFILGSIDFLFAFYEWNLATKAVQIGARVASVSDPVAKGLNFMSAAAVSKITPPGVAMPAFTITCDGAAEKCACDGACPEGVISFDQEAFNAIVYGRNSSGCGDARSLYDAGMCDIFVRIRPANVRIEYRQPAAPQGLGYVGRPGGPVPTIKVSLQHLPYRFIFLSFMLPQIEIPDSSTSVTGEDLSSCAPRAENCGNPR